MFFNEFKLSNSKGDILSIYKVIISSESSETRSHLAAVLPCVVSALRQNKSFSELSALVKLDEDQEYSLRISDGTVTFLESGRLAEFVAELQNIIYDESLMSESRLCSPFKY